MYRLINQNGAILSTEDKARYVRMQSNGVIVLCPENEAQGVVVNNDYPVNLDGRPPLPGVDTTVQLTEFNGPARLAAVIAEGAALAQASADVPSATVGLLAEGFPAWEAGKRYERYELFTYNGLVGFARQALTAQDIYPPFSEGTEALYGVRPVPADNGVYPYTYNMAASVGMPVSEDGLIYECIQAIDPMIYPPSQIPAHFKPIG